MKILNKDKVFLHDNILRLYAFVISSVQCYKLLPNVALYRDVGAKKQEHCLWRKMKTQQYMFCTF